MRFSVFPDTGGAFLSLTARRGAARFFFLRSAAGAEESGYEFATCILPGESAVGTLASPSVTLKDTSGYAAAYERTSTCTPTLAASSTI